MLRRLASLLALSLVLVTASAATASAHTELQPDEATAGTTQTLTFHVAYESAATTGLDVQLPDGASVVRMNPKPGWTASSDPEANTISWEGGPVEADEEFEVVVDLPEATGVVLFPAIQLTTDGEVPWIGEDEGEGHDDNPAPRLTLLADPSRTTTTESATTTSRELPGTTLEAANEGDGGSAVPWLIGSGIAAAVAIAAGGSLLKRRAG